MKKQVTEAIALAEVMSTSISLGDALILAFLIENRANIKRMAAQSDNYEWRSFVPIDVPRLRSKA